MITANLPTRFCIAAWGLTTAFCAPAQVAPTYTAAQAELHYFNEALANPSRASLPRMLIEVSEGKKSQLFWLNRVRLDGKEYVGRLETIPGAISSLTLGQELRIKAKDVLDWQYQDRDNGVIYGHYAVCSEFKAMPKKEARKQMTYWRIACKPKP